jgi:hypothetical protein
MLKETIIAKFTQVLAAIPQAQQDALAVELAKMIPATPDADVDWSVSWGYYMEKDEVGVTISLKIVPARESETEKLLLADLMTNLVNKGKENQLLDLSEALDIVLDDINSDKKMTATPALALTETTFAIRLRFWGAPSEKAKIDAEHEKELSPQIIYS